MNVMEGLLPESSETEAEKAMSHRERRFLGGAFFIGPQGRFRHFDCIIIMKGNPDHGPIAPERY